MITSTGENLSVLICCDHSISSDWMTFLSAYSFSKYLPEAKIAIACQRKDIRRNLFMWAKKLNFNFEILKTSDSLSYLRYFIEKDKLSLPALIVSPDIICVRELEQNSFLHSTKNYKKNDFYLVNDLNSNFEEKSDLYCDVKEDKIVNFVTYSNGWGNFNLSSWINKDEYPFHPLAKYNRTLLGLNERRLDDIWMSATNIFECIFRG